MSGRTTLLSLHLSPSVVIFGSNSFVDSNSKPLYQPDSNHHFSVVIRLQGTSGVLYKTDKFFPDHSTGTCIHAEIQAMQSAMNLLTTALEDSTNLYEVDITSVVCPCKDCLDSVIAPMLALIGSRPDRFGSVNLGFSRVNIEASIDLASLKTCLSSKTTSHAVSQVALSIFFFDGEKSPAKARGSRIL